jgi:hypothetical protein
MLVDGVVHHLPNEVMEAGAVMNVPDVHSWTLANGLETFEDCDVFAPVAGWLVTPACRRGAGGSDRRTRHEGPEGTGNIALPSLFAQGKGARNH